MATVNITMDGREIVAQAGQTVLQAARNAGIDIPTLCEHPAIEPIGACRMCLVEIEKQRALQPACTFRVSEGMVIHTRSDKVLATRKMIVELLLASHCGSCFMCDKANICELRQIPLI